MIPQLATATWRALRPLFVGQSFSEDGGAHEMDRIYLPHVRIASFHPPRRPQAEQRGGGGGAAMRSAPGSVLGAPLVGSPSALAKAQRMSWIMVFAMTALGGSVRRRNKGSPWRARLPAAMKGTSDPTEPGPTGNRLSRCRNCTTGSWHCATGCRNCTTGSWHCATGCCANV